MSVSWSTTIASLPPISANTRLIQIWPLRGFAASSLIRNPTARDPVNDTKRVFGCSSNRSPMTAPLPTHKLNDFAGKPASANTSANFAAIVGVSLDGLMMIVLPATNAATLIPARIASGKFQGGMMMPAPSGM